MHFLPAIFAIVSVLQIAITQDMAAGQNSTVQDPSAGDNSTVTATFTDGFDASKSTPTTTLRMGWLV
jgi:hypothetical protein